MSFCQSISRSRQAKRTTIGCVRLCSARCFRKRCCSRIVDTTRIGSGSLLDRKGHGQNIPPKRNRKDPIRFSPYLYRARNLVERFFNKIKQCRRVATRYDKLAANYLAFVKLASIRIWLRAHESTSWPKGFLEWWARSLLSGALRATWWLCQPDTLCSAPRPGHEPFVQVNMPTNKNAARNWAAFWMEVQRSLEAILHLNYKVFNSCSWGRGGRVCAAAAARPAWSSAVPAGRGC
jgi:hypothetical protein